jgi:subtilisin family serine protease
MSEKEYIVTLNKGVDYDAFNAEMIASTGAGDIPNRTVDVADARPGSLRNTHYALTDAEAAALRNDSRVVDVQIPPQDRDDIEIGFSAYQSGVWTRDTVTQQSNLNWGNLRCTRIEDPWNGNTLTDISDDYKYTLTGRGVDVVIQDSGIQPTHYQFTNDMGVSRVKQIDWYAASGLIGTQSANHYRDYNGHGSHCAGTVAGRTLGWAREADIYAVKVSGLEGSGDAGTGISVSNCFDVITGWHNNKPIDPKTGFKRPTVVNASWGYSGTRTGTLTGGVYNGQSWSTGAGQPWPDVEASHLEYAGIHGKYYSLGTERRINVRVASVDADLQDAIDAGIIFCIAAGNSYYYIDSATGPNWNDTANFGAGQENIFRGSSPYDTEAFIVGNIDNTYYNSKEQKAESSCFGPGVDINAPGTYIMSCASSDKSGACDLTDGTEASISTVNDPGTNNAQDPLMKISGTSMASPQVAGMIACILQANPGMTPAQMKTYIHNNSLQDLLWEDTNHNIVADTFTFPIPTANGTSAYTFTSTADRSGGNVVGDNPSITIYQGDTITLTNNTNSHPLYIKHTQGGGTGDQVTTPAATGQGSTLGDVSWTPALPGRYYYQCSSHPDMNGQIEVLPRIEWNNTDNIGDGPNRFLYSGLFATGDNLRLKGPVSWGK